MPHYVVEGIFCPISQIIQQRGY